MPDQFRQAVFDFKIYMGLSLGGQAQSHVEITVENQFPEHFDYRYCLDALRNFLTVTKAEVNLLPHNQTFNYNINCILSQATPLEREKYGVIQKLYELKTAP